jgi:transcriptional regulator
MYVPGQFAEPDIEVLHALIRSRPLATLVTLTPTGLNANHVPLCLSMSPDGLGTLRGHVSRANPMWRDFDRNVDTLAIFQGPDCYITPSWYATKAETGRVVPTWNYAVAHAYGALHVIEDPVWLRATLEELTDRNEARFDKAWRVEDAPREFTNRLMGSIIGIEIVITRLTGKWKVSQNQPDRNRQSLLRGLRAAGSDETLEMANLVEGLDRPR